MTSAAMDGDQVLPGKGKQKGGLFRTSTLRTGDFVAEVKPYWQKLSDADRQKLLTVPEALTYSRARDGAQHSKPKGSKADTKARQQEIFAQFLRSWDNLQEGLPMCLWRWEGDPDDDEYVSVEDFWEDLECEINHGELFDTLPKISRGGSIDHHATKQLYKFLCDLLEKLSHAQTQKVAEMKKSRFPRNSGEMKLLCENVQIEVIILILKELQESPYPILYQNIQAHMEKAINNVRLANARSATHFSIQKAHTILRQLQTGALKMLGEWLIMKVDEFKLLAQELLEGGGIENPREAYVLVSHPFTDHEEEQCLAVDTQWLEHLKVSKVDPSSPREKEDAHGSQVDETGLQLEWLFGAVVSNPEVSRQQAKRSPGLQPYTLEDARDALMDAMKAQRECQVARESARLVALGILQHRKDLQEFLKSHPDMYTIRQGDDEGNEDDREVPDDVLLFMLSRELHLCSAKIIINDSSSARAASNFVAFMEHIEEITHQTKKLDWETTRDQYCEPDESFDCFDYPEQRLEEHQAEEIAEEQENHSLSNEVEPKTTAVSKGYQERGSAEQPVRLTLRLWADWVLNQRDNLKMLMHIEAQSGRATDKKEVADLSDSTQAAAATAEVPQEQLPPLTKVTPKQEEWRRILRKRFNKMARPKLLSGKADKELLTELSKEIKAIELLLESGKASLQLLEKHFENLAFHDLQAKLSCVIVPLLRERVLSWARNERDFFASQAKRDLLHEEQVRVEKKKKK